MGKRTEPGTHPPNRLAELGKLLQGRSRSRRKERQIAAVGCLILGLGLLFAPKPEEPPLWLTTLFVSAVLTFTVSLGWLCRGLTEDVGYGASPKALIFQEFLDCLTQTHASEAIPAALEISPALSLAQQEALIPHLCALLGRLDDTQAVQLSPQQRLALEELVRHHPRTDLAILGLLALASARHSGEQLLPLAQEWARLPDRRGAAAREYLLSVRGQS